MKLRKRSKVLLIFIMMALVGGFFYFDFLRYFDFETFNNHKEMLLQLAEQKPAFLTLSLFLGYLFMAVLSLPGTLLLTLFSGFLFGLVKGMLVVSFALTIGATITFLFSRYFFRDFFLKKFAKRFKTPLSDLNKDGVYYLFAMRMIPAVPFFVPNTLMGLTSMKTTHYFFISYLGLLPEIAIYVNAGTHFSRVENLRDIFSFQLILSFLVIGFFPLLIKKIVSFIRKKNNHYGVESSDVSF